MKAIFVHDHIFHTDGKDYYSDKLPYSTWTRYLKYFNNITIFARLANNSVDIHKVPLSSGENVNFLFGPNISSLKSFFKTRGEQKQKLKNIIIQHDAIIVRLPSEYGLMAIDLAKELNIPVIIEVVACAWDSLWNYGHFKAKVYAPYMFYKMKRSVLKSDYVSYVTNKFLQKKYPTHGHSIAVSDVEIQEVNLDVLHSRFKKIDNKNNIIVFGLIGSFKTKYKGIHTAIETITLLNNKYPNIQLRILGTGDSSEYLEMAKKFKISDKIFFDGILSNGNEVFNWLDNIDIYLQPSFVEGMPRALIEAMSRACPIVATNVGDIPDLIDNTLIFTPGDAEKMSQIISLNISNKEWYKIQAEKNFYESKKYTKDILDNKRNNFFKHFIEFIKEST